MQKQTAQSMKVPRGTVCVMSCLAMTVLLIRGLTSPAVAVADNTDGSNVGNRTQAFSARGAGLESGGAITGGGLEPLGTLATPWGTPVGAGGIAALGEKRYRSDFTVQFPFGTRFSIAYKRLHRDDLLSPAHYEVQKKAVIIGLEDFFKGESFRASLAGDQLDKKPSDKKGDLERYNISVFWRPSGWRRYSGPFRAAHHTFVDAKRPSQVGIIASYRLTERLSFDNTFEKSGSDRDRWMGGLNYMLPNYHLVSLLGRYSNHGGDTVGDATLVALTYTIPFGLPVGRK